MKKPPETLPEALQRAWMSHADIDAAICARGYQKMTSVEVTYGFVRREVHDWVRYDHMFFGDPMGAAAVAEIVFTFAGQSGFKAVIGHEIDEAIALAHLLSAKANQAGARLHSIDGAVDTLFLDINRVDDFAVNLIPEHGHIYKLAYRMRGHEDWNFAGAMRFVQDQKRHDAILKLASAAGRDGYARLDETCHLPQVNMTSDTGEAFALYIKPASVIGVVVMQDHDGVTRNYVRGSTKLCVLYGHDRWLSLNYGDNISDARMAARRVIRINPRLVEIDDRKCVYADPVRFDHASAHLSPNDKSAGHPPSNRIYLHFKNHVCAISFLLPDSIESRRMIPLLNGRLADARKPRMAQPKPAGEVTKLPLRL